MSHDVTINKFYFVSEWLASGVVGMLWNRDPYYYKRRVKEAIHIRLHPNNISRDSGIEIPEAWMPTIKKQNNRRAVRQRIAEGANPWSARIEMHQSELLRERRESSSPLSPHFPLEINRSAWSQVLNRLYDIFKNTNPSSLSVLLNVDIRWFARRKEITSTARASCDKVSLPYSR